MGNLRTVLAWLCASTLGSVFALPHVTLADDAGPGKEVRAIRHDLPFLVGGRLGPPHVDSRAVVVDSVVIQAHGTANAEWHTSDQHRMDEFVRTDGWWLLRNEWTPRPGEHLEDAMSPPGMGGAKSAAEFSTQPQLFADLNGYQMRITFAPSNANAGAQITSISGRAPTEAEIWITRGGNSYFFFSGTVDSTAPIQVQAGTSVDVWFPFVLDTSLYYGITIAHADKPIGPIDGTLKDNVVHFVLPAFVLPPGATLMAEIEGDTFRHE
jgi:hypothetical protein